MNNFLAGRQIGYGAARVARNLVAAIAVAAAPMAWAEPVMVAALGDSLTQGYGLPQDDGFVPQLEDWLRDRGHDVVIVNAGVSGDTTAGGLSRLDWTLTPDVDALIVALGGNDLLRGIDPAASRRNLDAILTEATSRGLPVLLIGMQAPGNYGPDYKAAFEAIFPDLAEKHATLLVDSFFRGLTDGQSTSGARERFMQADGIHPNAAGVERIVDDLGPEVEQLIVHTAP